MVRKRRSLIVPPTPTGLLLGALAPGAGGITPAKSVFSVATLSQDSFTGTNGTDLAAHAMNVGPGWTNTNAGVAKETIAIEGNQAQVTTQGHGGSALYFTETGAAGVSISASLTAGAPVSSAFGFVFRYQDSIHFWGLIAGGNGDGTTAGLFLLENNGTVTAGDSNIIDQDNGSHAFTGAHTLKLVVAGTSLKVYWDGVLVWTPTTLTGDFQLATKHGLYMWEENGLGDEWDNWLVTNP